MTRCRKCGGALVRDVAVKRPRWHCPSLTCPGKAKHSVIVNGVNTGWSRARVDKQITRLTTLAGKNRS